MAENSRSKEALADSVISTVKSLQSQLKPSDGVVEVLEKDGYRHGRGKSAVAAGEMTVELRGSSQHPPAQVTTVDNTKVDGGNKHKKKTSKFHRIRLGDGSGAAVLDVRNSSTDPSSAVSSGWPKPSGGSRILTEILPKEEKFSG